jgi:hypothetical protein
VNCGPPKHTESKVPKLIDIDAGSGPGERDSVLERKLRMGNIQPIKQGEVLSLADLLRHPTLTIFVEPVLAFGAQDVISHLSGSVRGNRFDHCDWIRIGPAGTHVLVAHILVHGPWNQMAVMQWSGFQAQLAWFRWHQKPPVKTCGATRPAVPAFCHTQAANGFANIGFRSYV